MTSRTASWAAGLFIVASPSLALPAFAGVSLPDGFAHEVLVTGLDQPNSMAFLPDGRLLFTEQRSAKVRLVVNGHLAATDPVIVDEVENTGYERGLQGIAVDPAWPARPFVYVYFTRIDRHCVLQRYTASGSLSDRDSEDLTLGSPLIVIDDIPDNDPNHNSGCLRFGPDGHLFVSIGEDEDPCGAADSTSLKGELLRIDVSQLPAAATGPIPRGLITPKSNPLSTPDSNARLVWAYGMRNPWRFHVDPVTGLIYLADVGESNFEEVNEVLPGDYLGWPYREGEQVMLHDGCSEPGGEGINFYKPPLLSMEHLPDLTAIEECGVYRPVANASANWPRSYHGDLFYSEYYRGFLRRLTKRGDSWVPADTVTGQPNLTDWATGLVSAADFLIGPDGSLWVLRQFDDMSFSPRTGSLARIKYVGPDTTNTPTLVTLAWAQADPGRVRLRWVVVDHGSTVTVYRRESAGGWEQRAEIRPDGEGHVDFEDDAVLPGHRYGYRLGIWTGTEERFLEETWVDVPNGYTLALRGTRPNPGRVDPIVAFSVPDRAAARIEFYDVAGRRAAERDLGVLEPGSQWMRLSGLDLAPGMYVMRLSQGARSVTGRAIIVR